MPAGRPRIGRACPWWICDEMQPELAAAVFSCSLDSHHRAIVSPVSRSLGGSASFKRPARRSSEHGNDWTPKRVAAGVISDHLSCFSRRLGWFECPCGSATWCAHQRPASAARRFGGRSVLGVTESAARSGIPARHSLSSTTPHLQLNGLELYTPLVWLPTLQGSQGGRWL